MNEAYATIPFLVLERMDMGWTFFLLLARFLAMMATVPGLGQGVQGIALRIPAIVILTFAQMSTTKIAPLPDNAVIMAWQVFSEILVGSLFGIIPMMIVSGAQAAGYIATTAIGLSGAQLFDPTSNTSVSDLARIYGDLTVILFLLVGGGEVVMQGMALYAESVTPGGFFLTAKTLDVLIERSSDIFRIGVMVASPVIVALLLTNFVMGLIVKAVPTVNVMAVSFPLMIGIGLVLTMVALPEGVHFLTQEMKKAEKGWSVVVEEGRRIEGVK